MPLIFMFQEIFKIPKLLELTLFNAQNCFMKNTISNFASGEIYRQQKSNFSETDFMIPYVLYFDDFEIDNPVGSHKISICGAYISFPTMTRYSTYFQLLLF